MEKSMIYTDIYIAEANRKYSYKIIRIMIVITTTIKDDDSHL